MVVGAPMLLLAVPPETLLMELTLSTPLRMLTLPVKVLAPERIQVPVPSLTIEVVLLVL